MKELLFFGGFLAGMTATSFIFLWDGRIKRAKDRKREWITITAGYPGKEIHAQLKEGESL